MAFRLPTKAREWFKNLGPDFDEGGAKLFDMYYFCAMMGLAAMRKNHEENEKSAEFIQYFPGEFKTRGSLVMALFLSRELRFHRIRLTERIQLHKAIAELVDPKDPANLSATGMKELNAYVHGGFDTLLEEFGGSDNKPQLIATFLPLYRRKLEKVLWATETQQPAI